jgi:hypothetical protein
VYFVYFVVLFLESKAMNIRKVNTPHNFLFGLFLSFVVLLVCGAGSSVRGAEGGAKVYVVLWFDTEDYILPASDDAALQVADFLSQENVRATFKVVGEKARTLERRGRQDVIDALKKHEIGYHSNWHSVQPSPAMYLSNLGWDEGVAEFDRREKPGYDDVKRIFGVAPSCYGQPGSSWGPQVYGAMRKWGMPVYLDAGSHVRLDDKPFYYCGILTLYKLEFTLRADLAKADLKDAEDRFLEARKKLLAEGGGVVSIFYHPCEFVHREFWDGVNFRKGANPPREQWKLPPTKSPEESRLAYQVFDDYIHFIKRFPEVRFITASEAARIYRDKARGRAFSDSEVVETARAVSENVTFQQRAEYELSAAEMFALLNECVLLQNDRDCSGPFTTPATTHIETSPYGPTGQSPVLTTSLTTDWSQFIRTATDVSDCLHRQGRIPSTVWLGSVGVPPEAYLQALARVTIHLAENKRPPEKIEVRPAKLAVARYVADDGPNLWGWVIFPDGFRAPAMMALAKQQAWTLKPARIDTSRK